MCPEVCPTRVRISVEQNLASREELRLKNLGENW